MRCCLPPCATSCVLLAVLNVAVLPPRPQLPAVARQMQEQQLRARQLVLQQQAASAVAAASKTQREVGRGRRLGWLGLRGWDGCSDDDGSMQAVACQVAACGSVLAAQLTVRFPSCSIQPALNTAKHLCVGSLTACLATEGVLLCWHQRLPHPRPLPTTPQQIYVGNLTAGLVTEDMLRQLFSSTMAAAFPDMAQEGARAGQRGVGREFCCRAMRGCMGRTRSVDAPPPQGRRAPACLPTRPAPQHH